MSRAGFILAALLVGPACDGAESSRPDDAKPAEGPGQAPAGAGAGEASAAEAPEATDPWAAALASRVLAESGLGVGGRLSAFSIVNVDTAERYCQVCRYGPSPKLMAVGTADDAGFHEDLKNLDAIVTKYGPDRLKAFAVVTELRDGRAVTSADPQAMQRTAKELKDRLRLSIPLVVVAHEDGDANRVWDEYYNITRSRTVMFADGHNVVKYSGVATEDFADLNAVIVDALGT